MVKNKKSNLAERLAIFSNPTPIFEDPEEEDDLYTRAQLDDQYDEDNDDVIEQSSSLRKKNASLLESTDKKYLGTTISRKDLEIDQDEPSDDTEGSINEDSFSIDLEFTKKDDIRRIGENKKTSLGTKAERDKVLQMFTEEHGNDGSSDEDENDEYEVDSDENKTSGDEGSVEGNTYEEEVDSNDDSQDDKSSDEDESRTLKPFSNQDIDEEIQKGNAAKTQLGLWDSFMELRIKLQKALSMTNQVPQNDTFPQIKMEGGKDLHNAQRKVTQELASLLDTLLELQELLLLQNPETKHVVHGGKPKVTDDDDDEEILSDEEIPIDDEKDEEEETIEKNDSTRILPPIKKKRKLQDYEEIVAKRHKNLNEFRNMTLQKWHDKTKVASGKISSKSFSSFDRSVLKQIEQILVDQDRLVKRTQLKRTTYKVIGKIEEKEENIELEGSEDIPVQQNQHLKDYDPEIFDDDDFYHQLIRELIEKRTASTTDPTQLTRQWLEVQKLRSKVCKKVDTKASKGRKIRYDVHQKLVSFMASDETCSMSEESRTELYKSLFGQQLGKVQSR